MIRSHSAWVLTAPALLVAGMAAYPAIAEDKNIGYISLYDNGAYNIDPIVLKWKRDGKVYSKKMGAKIGNSEFICIDLSKVDGIQKGDEVWIVAHIEAGETVSCKKDNKRFYEPGNNDVWFLRMSGETFTNNHCKNSSNPGYDATERQKGNSSYCEFGD